MTSISSHPFDVHDPIHAAAYREGVHAGIQAERHARRSSGSVWATSPFTHEETIAHHSAYHCTHMKDDTCACEWREQGGPVELTIEKIK